MSAHTPGPWVARPDPNACLEDDWCVGIGDSLANIDKVAVCSKQDAHLIAAAPDLLEALKYCRQKIEYMRTHGEWYSPGRATEMAEAAIAKATGGAV